MTGESKLYRAITFNLHRGDTDPEGRRPDLDNPSPGSPKNDEFEHSEDEQGAQEAWRKHSPVEFAHKPSVDDSAHEAPVRPRC